MIILCCGGGGEDAISIFHHRQDNENDEWAVGEGDKIIDCGGGMEWLQPSEPSGEGVIVFNVVGGNLVDIGPLGNNDDIGGGWNLSVHFVEIPKFWSDFGAGDDFLGVALVESIDKRSIFDLHYSTDR